jgi:hypothetical protein
MTFIGIMVFIMVGEDLIIDGDIEIDFGILTTTTLL